MALLPFSLASLVGRGRRFFMLAARLKFGGKTMEEALQRYVHRLGRLTVVIVVLAIIVKAYG